MYRSSVALICHAVAKIVINVALISFASAKGSDTQRKRLLATRHLSEQADVTRQVLGSPHTGQGWKDATTHPPGAATAASSGSDANEGACAQCLYPSSVVGQALPTAPVGRARFSPAHTALPSSVPTAPAP